MTCGRFTGEPTLSVSSPRLLSGCHTPALTALTGSTTLNNNTGYRALPSRRHTPTVLPRHSLQHRLLRGLPSCYPLYPCVILFRMYAKSPPFTKSLYCKRGAFSGWHPGFTPLYIETATQYTVFSVAYPLSVNSVSPLPTVAILLLPL